MPLKVLTVDDSKTIRMIVKKAFRPFNVNMAEAENGELGFAAASKEKPDLIVLDITMPVMTGTEMLAKLKDDPVLKDVPVIMLTAESGKENVMEIVKLGVKDYIVKPFKGEQLIERARGIVTLEEKQGGASEPDEAAKYFSVAGDKQILALPAKITRPVCVTVEGLFKARIQEMAKAGMSKLILDLSKVAETNVSLIKLIITIIEGTQKASVHIRVVGTAKLQEELKGFAETSEIPIHLSLDEVKSTF